MYFIHLHVNVIEPKIEELRHLAKITNASVTGISETEFDGYVLSNEAAVEGYNLIRLDCSRKGGGVARFTKHSVVSSQKTNMRLNTERIFIEPYLPKSKPFVVGILYKPP